MEYSTVCGLEVHTELAKFSAPAQQSLAESRIRMSAKSAQVCPARFPF